MPETTDEILYISSRWIEDGVFHIHEWPDRKITPVQAAERMVILAGQAALGLKAWVHPPYRRDESILADYQNISLRVHLDLPSREFVQTANIAHREHFLAAIDRAEAAARQEPSDA